MPAPLPIPLLLRQVHQPTELPHPHCRRLSAGGALCLARALRATSSRGQATRSCLHSQARRTLAWLAVDPRPAHGARPNALDRHVPPVPLPQFPQPCSRSSPTQPAVTSSGSGDLLPGRAPAAAARLAPRVPAMLPGRSRPAPPLPAAARRVSPGAGPAGSEDAGGAPRAA